MNDKTHTRKPMRITAVLTIALMTTAFAFNNAIAKEHTIDQKNKTFVMSGEPLEALDVKVGDTIHFRNMDPWFHNIFSLSDIKTFDLGSYPKGESRPVTFSKAGTIEIECAIHPQMYIEVNVTN